MKNTQGTREKKRGEKEKVTGDGAENLEMEVKKDRGGSGGERKERDGGETPEGKKHRLGGRRGSEREAARGRSRVGPADEEGKAGWGRRGRGAGSGGRERERRRGLGVEEARNRRRRGSRGWVEQERGNLWRERRCYQG